MRCDDGNYYVVKFQNNPQGGRVLANEMLAGRLALTLGLPVTVPEVIEVSDWLVDHSPEMYIQRGSERIRCASGLQFGSRFPCDPLRSAVYDFLPDTLLEKISNCEDLLGALVFDKWTCNCDSRQFVFHQHFPHQYTATMIDQGFCFNASEWDFPDAPARGVYPRPAVYAGVSGLHSFEPFLTRLSHLDCEILEEAAARIPPEWYEARVDDLGALVQALWERRNRVASLILECRQAKNNPFPSWKSGGAGLEAM
jgi:hypothetical protein